MAVITRSRHQEGDQLLPQRQLVRRDLRRALEGRDGRAQAPCVRRARDRIVGGVFELISRCFGASLGAPAATGLASVLRGPL